MKTRFLIGFLLTSILALLRAQEIKIIDKNTLLPLSNVKIQKLKTEKTVFSDENGRVDLSLFNDEDSLVFTCIGYKTFKITAKEAKASKKIYMEYAVIPIREVVVSASKFRESSEDLPQLQRIIPSATIHEMLPQTTGELLENTATAYVQQSQFGGGSPILRGLEANRVLLVVDGIRMNNAIYRSGHLQNIITVDPEMLDRVEVIYGPGSVVYGSDALGGVISMITPNPIFSKSGKMEIHGKAMTKYATASAETFNSLGLFVGLKRIASYTNVTYKNLGDLKTGNIRNPAYGDFGKCLYYFQRINDVDSTVANPNPNIQRNSGYWQADAIQKFAFKINDHHKLTANVQYSTSSNVPRYDRLTEMSGGNMRYAEWYYGPQNRLLGALSYEGQQLGFADEGRVVAAFQKIDEDRIVRRFNKVDRRYQKEDVKVYSLNLDFAKQIKRSELRYGLEMRYDDVKSQAYNENINTGSILYNAVSRYPDDYNMMYSGGAFLNHAIEFGSKVVLTQGIRYQYVQLKSAWTDTMMNLTGFPFDNIVEQKNGAFSGNLGGVLKLPNGWSVAVNFASGFRAPNVDDVGKVNDSKAGDHLLVIPSPTLKPEYAYSSEITIRNVKENWWNIENTVFYTYLDNVIVLRPAKLNGQDSVMFGGQLCQVQANTNAGSAYIVGNQFNMKIKFNENMFAKTYLTYTYGRVDKETPLDHIPPVYGMTEFSYRKNKFTGMFYIRYSGWKRLKDYSQSGEDNLQYATPWGMPGWHTLNVKAIYDLLPNLTFSIALENIMDVHYRKFASGISSPGRNLILSFRAKF
ncbi:MAG: TonB-dependent receptor plug domain-containing protein [Bacteroidales bacterium]|nr:TonB-dependent receptor plug domain-containing protein [Bacteroidales bacterium]